jgi:hypothetical protein
MCFLRGPCREFKAGQNLELSTAVRLWPVDKGLSAEAEESSLLEAVTRKLLVEKVTEE